MFSCATPAPTGGCSISVKDGVVESIQGYTFRALVSTDTTATPDADYLAWGVWLTVPNDVPVDDTPSAATAGAFASGNDVFAVMPALKGTATYNGDATRPVFGGRHGRILRRGRHPDGQLRRNRSPADSMLLLRMTGFSWAPSPEPSPTSWPAACPWTAS